MLNEAVIRVLCACFSARIKQKRSLAFASDLGALEGTRTPDLLIRSQTLYPAELPTRNMMYYSPGWQESQHFLKNFFEKTAKTLKIGDKTKQKMKCFLRFFDGTRRKSG